MDSLVIAAIAFACSIGGVVLGVYLRRRLPEAHLSGDSKDVIKAGFGLIATMVALVLGLLVASAKSSFDAEVAGFQQLSTNIIILDRNLASYGAETGPTREMLRRAVIAMIDRLWPAESGTAAASTIDSRELTSIFASLLDSIRGLTPKDENQRSSRSEALQTCGEFRKARWKLSQPSPPLLPTPFLVVLVFWLTALFASFGLLTQPNATVLTTLFLCALSISGAIFLVVDLGEPHGGLIRVSSASLRYGQAQLGQ